MPGIHVRSLSPALLDALKRRAAQNHRSLQKEVHHILEQAAREGPPPEPPGSILDEVTVTRTPASPDFTWSREEMYSDDGR